jgi:hypothetical protein
VTADRVEFNDLKATILGWDPADFREGGYRAFTGLVHPEDLGKTMEAMVQVLNGTTSLYQVDYRIQDAWGSYRHFFDRGIVLGRGASGRPVLLRGLVVDLGREGEVSGGEETVISLMTRSVEHYDVTGRSSVVLCSCCRQAKVEDGRWAPVSADLLGLIGQEVSHGLCPSCLRALYPEWAERVLDRTTRGRVTGT